MTNIEVAVANRPGMLPAAFEPDIESKFQTAYYYGIRTTLRRTVSILCGWSVLAAILHLIFSGSTAYFLSAGANLLLVALAYREEFAAHWQPVVVQASLVALVPPIFALARDSDGGQEPIIPIAFCMAYGIVVVFRGLRLQTRWMVVLLGGVQFLSVLAILTGPRPSLGNLVGDFIPTTLAMLVPFMVTVRHERHERGEFLTKFLLTEAISDERRKREQTEQMLQVLSQAIGGIVHDLGNPLTAVQTGAQTLLAFNEAGQLDPELVQEFAEMITDGAQMLNYLRLALMEETRVLEGKPIPIEVAPASIRAIVTEGSRYQKPKFASGRTVSLETSDLEVCVDKMRLVTVFMNLIGNALKYSDGPVHVTWFTHEQDVMVAVLDQGRNAVGITREQAEKLFVAFGRLEAHFQVEGTGLGLLSVRKIVEAHGGEVYIEGYQDGTPQSPPFRTARRSHPAVLTDASILAGAGLEAQDYRTAFVVVCPLAPAEPGTSSLATNTLAPEPAPIMREPVPLQPQLAATMSE